MHRSNMAMPIQLPYDPDVDNFGSRILEIKPGQRITFDEALLDPILVEKALQVNFVPIQFTMYVLRKMAVHEKDFRHFKRAFPRPALDYLSRLIGVNPEINRYQYRKRKKDFGVHPSRVSEEPSSFRGIYTKIFCKKVISNLNDQQDEHYDHLVATFPFKIFNEVPDYEIEILNVLDDDFYEEIGQFLDQHFTDENAREMCAKFLKNIRHFVETFDPEQSLRKRLEAEYAEYEFQDYLTSFVRFNQEGIEWMEYLYEEYNNIQRNFEINVPLPVEEYNTEYFRKLPENNFVDLYSFLDPAEFRGNRQIYTEKFKKYLFFFIHSSKVDSNLVLSIDDMLFECSKSLRRYKTLKEDVEMVQDLAKMCVLHLRLKPNRRKDNMGRYCIHDLTLKNMKRYVTRFVQNQNPRLNAIFKANLETWMPFRTKDTCFNVCYSKWSEIKNFRERVLCSVLWPEEDRIRYIVSYNAYRGTEDRFVLPENIVDSLRNFIKLCNTRDATDEPWEEAIDRYMKKLERVLERESDRDRL